MNRDVKSRRNTGNALPMTDLLTKIKGDFRNQPILATKVDPSVLDYYQIGIDVNGPLNQEGLVNLSSHGIAFSSVYARARPPYYRSFAEALPTVWVRKTVADKLIEVNQILLPYEMEVFVLDGYRPIVLQKELWNHFIDQGRRELGDVPENQLVRFAEQYCSDPRKFDPRDPKSWPVHNTGGAIDLTLRYLDDGQAVFMGGMFDDAHAVSSTRFYENLEHSSQSAVEAQRNRRLLYHSMCAVGFASYDHEWWHFDYGTQMWVIYGGHDCLAYYGRIDVPS